MKCLSVRQPHAFAIVSGRKRVENRSWPTSYRGPLLIHAGLSLEGVEADGCLADGTPYDLEDLHFGAIVGAALLTDCLDWDTPLLGGDPQAVDLAFDPFAGGPYCWLLEAAFPFRLPVRLKGNVGLFDVGTHLLDPLDLVRLQGLAGGPKKSKGNRFETRT